MRFPVLCIPRDFGIYVVNEQKSLGKCRVAALFWRADVYNGMRIVDSDGDTFEVTRYRIVRPRGKFGLAMYRILDLGVEVALETQPAKRFSLDQIKAVVRTSINIDAEAFDELSGKSIEWWSVTLENASSVAEVINAFTLSADKT